jgi:hypothetical protein
MTENEYDCLREAAEGQGARSVSEFARNVLLGAADPDPLPDCHCAVLNTLDERITKVEQDVAEVRNQLFSHIDPEQHPPLS